MTTVGDGQAAIQHERLETPSPGRAIEGETHLAGRRQTVSVDVGGVKIGSATRSWSSR